MSYTKRKGLSKSLTLLALCSLAFANCAKKESEKETPAPSAPENKSSKDEAVQTSKVSAEELAEKAPIESPKIISIGGSITEILFALDLGSSVVGTDSSSSFPAAVTDLPKVGSHHSVSVEAIAKLNPNLALVDSKLSPQIAEQIEKLGIKVARIDGVETLDEVGKRIREIGGFVGKKKESEQLASKVEAEIEAEIAKAEKSTAKLMFIYARGARILQVGGKGTAAHGMIESVAINAAGNAKGFSALNPEAAAASAPDIILMMKSGVASLESRDSVFGLPGISLTPAGKNKRLVEMDGLLLLGYGPRTAQAIAELRTHINNQMETGE